MELGGFIDRDFSPPVSRIRNIRMPTKAKGLMTKKFLTAATTALVLLLKVLFSLRINEEAMQDIVLKVASYFLGQDALNAEAVPA
tara:strand:- start:1687 stop:1941 length:255 start_codon:yes stop_codon:yes gene_type:complete